MTALCSDPSLTESTLDKLVVDIEHRGFSIQASSLHESTCSRLLADARQLDESHLLHRAGVGRERAELANIRGDRILWLEAGLTAATDGFLVMADRIRLHLNRHLYLGLVEYEGHLACYGPGAGYKKHLDRIEGSDARVLTLIAYLNTNWNDADGGQLRLHLQNEEHKDVSPQAGTVVAFLSGDYQHEVLPSRRERWAITGWFRQAIA